MINLKDIDLAAFLGRAIFALALCLMLFSGSFAHHETNDEDSDEPSDITMVNRVSLFSEYYTRGLSQTSELVAPQFETTLFHDSGLFGGVFVSRVEFPDGDQADQELDLYLAYQETLDNGLYYRIGGIYYTFPNADSSLDYDFFELDLAVGYTFDPVYTELYLRTSSNHFGSSGHSRYVRLAVVTPIYDDLKFKSHIAHRYVEDNETFYNIPDAFDWEVGIEYRFVENTDFILRYVDSSFKHRECLNSDYCSGRFIMGISYFF